ncbi:hypothetical protein [Candidatus Jidaibacter acanthamoebae]|nr:hypothetical protein [Candidatus Jidaibacter acanthamoeba]
MEANEEYKIKMHKNFNLFLAKYLPRFYDAHNSVDDIAELKNSQNFTTLNSQEKFHYVIPYLSLLKINFINKQFKELSSFTRFKKYITYMAFEANNISALETEIAKFTFFNYSAIKNHSSQLRCKYITKNFIKKYKTAEELFQNCLNAAREITYYRATIISELMKINGYTQDSWLITADKGIKALSDVIGFVVNENNPMSPLARRFIDDEVYNSSDYWYKCNEMYNNLTLLRLKMSSRCSHEEMYDRLLNCVKQLEKDL